MDDLGQPSSYLTLKPGAPVYSSDGEKLGDVEHVLADPEVDVFDGIVLHTSILPGGHQVRRRAPGAGGLRAREWSSRSPRRQPRACRSRPRIRAASRSVPTTSAQGPRRQAAPRLGPDLRQLLIPRRISLGSPAVRTLMLIFAACAAIAIAGCGGDDSTTGSDTGESAATTTK